MAKTTLTGKVIACRDMEANEFYAKGCLAVRMDAGFYTDEEVDSPVKCIAEWKVRQPDLIEMISERHAQRVSEGKQMRIKLRNVEIRPARNKKTGELLPIKNGVRNWDVIQKNKYKPVQVEEIKPFVTQPEVKLLDD